MGTLSSLVVLQLWLLASALDIRPRGYWSCWCWSFVVEQLSFCCMPLSHGDLPKHLCQAKVPRFLEDTTMVKITHAMGVGDFSAVRSVFLLGVRPWCTSAQFLIWSLGGFVAAVLDSGVCAIASVRGIFGACLPGIANLQLTRQIPECRFGGLACGVVGASLPPSCTWPMTPAKVKLPTW